MNQKPHSVALLVPELKELLQAKDYPLLKDVIRECSPLDFADSWRAFAEEDRLQLFRLLPATSALKLFEILDVGDQRHLLEKLGEETVAPILEGADSPGLAKIFHKMPPRVLKKMTGLIKRQEALAHIDYLMTFPEHTAGSLMHPEFVKLTPKLTAKQALSRLQAIARPNQKDHLYTSLFVTDEEGRLLGALGLQDLISAPEDEKLSELMTSAEGIKIRPETDQEDVSKLFYKYQIGAAPVVDGAGKLIGILTVGDIIAVVRQEATEDITKMAGTRASELLETSLFRITWLRTPWLVVTLIGGFVISVIIKHFEPTLSKIIALASFSPLIAGMGGNVGSQTATIIVRSIALGHIRNGDKLKIVVREMAIGALMGAAYGLVLGGIAYLLYGDRYGAYFSLVVAVGMCTSMTVASTMGSIEPILFHRLGIDPATATGPLITTSTDIISNLVYFSLATFLLVAG